MSRWLCSPCYSGRWARQRHFYSSCFPQPECACQRLSCVPKSVRGYEGTKRLGRPEKAYCQAKAPQDKRKSKPEENNSECSRRVQFHRISSKSQMEPVIPQKSPRRVQFCLVIPWQPHKMSQITLSRSKESTSSVFTKSYHLTHLLPPNYY